MTRQQSETLAAVHEMAIGLTQASVMAKQLVADLIMCLTPSSL